MTTPADKSCRRGCGCRYGSGFNTSLTEWKTIFPLCFSPHLPCFYKPPPPLIRENFPAYPFLGFLLHLAAVHQEDVPTCARDLEKKKKSPHPLERYWEPVTAAATPVLRRLPVLRCMNKSEKCLNLQLFCFFQFLLDLCFLSFPLCKL